MAKVVPTQVPRGKHRRAAASPAVEVATCLAAGPVEKKPLGFVTRLLEASLQGLTGGFQTLEGKDPGGR